MKDLVWNVFKKTGNINTYLEFRKIKDLEENLKVKANENTESKWNNNSRK